jgi:hypothetical protein
MSSQTQPTGTLRSDAGSAFVTAARSVSVGARFAGAEATSDSAAATTATTTSARRTSRSYGALADGAQLPERRNRSHRDHPEDDPEDPVAAQQQDEREQHDDRGRDACTPLQALPRACSRRHAHSGVLRAASFAFSSGDIGSLTATRT